MSRLMICGTYGRGLQTFVLDYLHEKGLEICDDTIEGRFIFYVPVSRCHELKHLKYFERLFLAIYHEKFLIRKSRSEIINICRLVFQENYDKIDKSIRSFDLIHFDHRSERERTFRFSCKISGKKKSRIDAKRLAFDFASRVKALKLNVALKDPRYEFSLKINDEVIFFGLQLFREPISKRLYLDASGLRSPVCDAMASLSLGEINKIGFSGIVRVLDPFCGVGNLLVEILKRDQNSIGLGMDFDIQKVTACNSLIQNRCNWLLKDRIYTVCSKFNEHLPFIDESIDVVVSDLPFGQKLELFCDQSQNLSSFYTNFFKECLRILKNASPIIILISSNLLETVAHLSKFVRFGSKYLVFKDSYQIWLGLNPASICLLSVEISEI